jgi:D-lactate dehydrogenase (cytochrome)
MLPGAVACVRSTEEVSKIMAPCHEYRVPVIPYGNGSSIEGQLLAARGGLSFDFPRMRAIKTTLDPNRVLDSDKIFRLD